MSVRANVEGATVGLVTESASPPGTLTAPPAVPNRIRRLHAAAAANHARSAAVANAPPATRAVNASSLARPELTRAAQRRGLPRVGGRRFGIPARRRTAEARCRPPF